MVARDVWDTPPSASDAARDPTREDGHVEEHLDDPNAYPGRQDQDAPVLGRTDEATNDLRKLVGQDQREAYWEEGNLGIRKKSEPD